MTINGRSYNIDALCKLRMILDGTIEMASWLGEIKDMNLLDHDAIDRNPHLSRSAVRGDAALALFQRNDVCAILTLVLEELKVEIVDKGYPMDSVGTIAEWDFPIQYNPG